MGKYGYLIPDSYVREVPGEVDMNTASIFWGFSLGVAVFSAGKAGKQSWRSWKRARRLTAYVAMVWAVWFSSMVLGALAWGFQRQYIDPSFGFYFCVALFWALQVQFLLQIILNRLGLLMVVPGQAAKLKWLVFGIILAINISVFIIWMPARLQINDTWVHLNEIWDRCEKVIFALVDGALNGYFIYLVRSRLIENGLTKYTPLYRMNLVLIFVSLSLDVVLVGLMSMKSSLVYLSFHPVCYLLKLQIEMKMAELITKIVRSTGRHGSDDIYYRQSSTGDKSKTAGGTTKVKFSNGLSGAQGTFRQGNTTQIEAGDQDSDIEMEIRDRATDGGIIKTTHTTVASSPVDIREDDDSHSRTSSTRKLHY
ncbi:hypothetical protein B0J15DRAFT_491306 [Fusarium solani]|uniref:Integral membrane protein n=1 Tax=Fusarium solani TaxID=169388 RepID=A0A9P9HLQ5_FUSSL|nr:uncharacterized protein B0J15DRAFT_491306 [Fusarium solani]KAH7259870.1 hypothetical protein B0J15DRAFT_491306 [Fusarium solani]